MSISTFELFSIGIGPSSSHTVGPMRAAYQFLTHLGDEVSQVEAVKVELFGSLAWTGEGHGTIGAILAGLEGQQPETVDPVHLQERLGVIQKTEQLNLASQKTIQFPASYLILNKKDLLPEHSNGMRFTAYANSGDVIKELDLYSIGGGFVVDKAHFTKQQAETTEITLPYNFDSAAQLLQICQEQQLSIAEVMLVNEIAWWTQEEVEEKLQNIWRTMDESIQHGCHGQGLLPGRLQVKRRAGLLYEKLQQQIALKKTNGIDMNWLSVYAIAVNEENAAGGRVVTAPTNGAAGIIPSVLKYALSKAERNPAQVVQDFLLTASAIGLLYKKNASISAAEVGCQGEVGVACSMAAAGYAAVMGGTPEQIENAAEIGMEHHLGLTCDPIAGLVQIPCIERNAMGSVQAVNAAQLALLEEGSNKVSLDEVIQTMRQTGLDMSTNYKETALGGLAVNVPEC